MQRLHLKLFYLRTRYKREPQGTTAKILGVRPATMSHLEQGRSLPTLPMLMALSKHYDVTATYLLDDDRPIEPQARDRLTHNKSVISRGDWLEVPEGAVIKTADGVLLCPVMDGASFYGATAQAQRILCRTREDVERLEMSLAQIDKHRDKDLEENLKKELLGQRKPRNKKGLRSITETSPKMAAEART